MGDKEMTTTEFIRELERTGTPLEQQEVVRALIDAAVTADRMPALLDAAFQSKFIVKTQKVMRRIGPNGPGYQKCSSEFQFAAETLVIHLRELQEVLAPELRTRLEEDYCALEPESFMRLLSLANDLNRIKNWEIDGHPLPGMALATPSPSAISSEEKGDRGLQKRISILLPLVLLAYLLLEPPVTTLGIVTVLLLTFLAFVNMMLMNPFGSLVLKIKRKGNS